MTVIVRVENVRRIYVDTPPASLAALHTVVLPGDVIVCPATGQEWAVQTGGTLATGVGSVAWDDVQSKPASFPATAHTHPEYDGVDPHTHPIADVVNLQAGLDGKADEAHEHTIADTVGLQASLDAKAGTSHAHAQSDVTGLAASLGGKSDVGHTHTIAATTGLQAALDGKSATGHGHTIGEVAELEVALEGKSATSHNHDGTYSLIGHDHAGVYAVAGHTHGGVYEPANANIQTHVGQAHAPSDAQKNSDITKAEIEAKLTGVIASHSHAPAEITGTAVITSDSRLSDARTPTSHSITGAQHSFPGGTTNFLRADGTFAAPTAAAADPVYASGSFTVATGSGRIHPKRLELVSADRVTLAGTARLVLCG